MKNLQFGSYMFGLFETKEITGNSKMCVTQLLDKVKFHSYWWLAEDNKHWYSLKLTYSW
jgi:hypothetical protein